MMRGMFWTLAACFAVVDALAALAMRTDPTAINGVIGASFGVLVFGAIGIAVGGGS